MKKDFSSEALKANLAQTRNTDIYIPQEQKWFTNLSKSNWGIHKRTKEFIHELNHQYVNYEYVIKNLHNICLTDLWFYNSLDQSEKALNVLVHIFEKLFKADLKTHQRELLITTHIKFIDRLAKLGDFPKSIIHQSLDIIKKNMDQYKTYYIRNSGYFKTYLNKVVKFSEYNQVVIDMTKDLVGHSINFWKNTTHVEEWFQKNSLLFENSYTNKIENIGKLFFEELQKKLESASSWDDVTQLPFFNDIANYFRMFSDQFHTAHEKIYYIYYLLHLPGMVHLKKHLLYDINRSLRSVLKELDEDEVTNFLSNIISLFKELKEEQASTVLDCINTLGKEVVDTRKQKFISYFIKEIIQLGFIYPGRLAVNNDWQMQANTNHVKNIRVWLELIEYSPSTMKELLAAFIVNLKLGGIFISDTDLFQRDVTKLLNSNISSVYREMKQLARIFPVYFRDIGAEGKLREITTAIDELSMRKDRLIHFLRKQTHTESNNTHIELSKKMIQYWYDGNPKPLQKIIPENVYNELDTTSQWYRGVHEVLLKLCKQNNSTPEELLQFNLDDLEESIFSVPSKNKKNQKRVLYLFQIHSMLLEKYSLNSENIIAMLKEHKFFRENEINKLQESLETKDLEGSLNKIYKMMKHLKDIILDSKESQALENIYYKRHIAIGIPSMYGQYIEPKFEALGLTFRLEKTASNLMSKLLQSINLEYITAKTFRHIYDILILFKEGLALDGIYNQGFNSNIEMFRYSLTSPSFSLDQYINLFQFMAQSIKQIINEYFLEVYENPLKMIIPQLFSSEDIGSKQLYHMESEKFLRENLSSAFLVQDLDNFITTIISNLRSMIDTYSPSFIKNMMTYDPDLTISPLYKETIAMDNPIFLGAKAYFLKKLISYDFPVPPGFVLTTEVFRHHENIIKHPYIKQEMDQFILNQIRALENKTNLKLGDTENPLLLSVRSGTAISMPGAMRTFLNVGINDEIAEGLSKKEDFEWTAWDSYRRFLQSWGMAHGMERDVFDQIILKYKEKYGTELKVQFTPKQMKEIAYAYKGILKEHAIHIESNPFLQLKQAIVNVITSWSSKSAISYRNHLQVADEWGTAIIVQKMALGNVSSHSGTGVVFTKSPFNDKSGINLYGDFTLCSQGEDIVSGLVHTLPITENQRKEHAPNSSVSLQSRFPGIYNALLDFATQLIETYGFIHQEIEFTFESEDPNDLYILQIRNQNKIQKDSSHFIPSPKEMKLVGRGIGGGGGALSGILAFDMDDLNKAIENYPKEKRILVRPDTVPDDIPLIFKCDGLLTAKGGATSHAAVTASNLGKTCVVNCKGLIVDEMRKKCIINGAEFISEDKISIDGNLGNVYQGKYNIQYK